MTLKQKIFSIYEDIFDKCMQIHKYRVKVRKFEGLAYKSIYSAVELTPQQKKQIDDFYLKNYGKKIPYIYHQYCMAFTGKFDINYLPEIFYIPALEHFMHYNGAYTRALADKNLISLVAASIGIKTPKTLLSRVSGVFRDENFHAISRAEFEREFAELGEVFVKPSLDSSGGHRCAVVCIRNGKDIYSQDSIEKIIDSLGYDFVIQQRLQCHQALRTLYPHSCNTFRFLTYQWKDRFYHTPLALRIGQGNSVVDNASSGGMFITVDDDGTMHKTAFTEFNKQYTRHPDTHVVFEKYHIPHIQKMIDAAIRLHELVPQIGIAHWDFTLSQEGEPVLIEANLRCGGIWLVQLSHGKGPFGERTAEIIRWIVKMQKIPYSKRKQYRFGYMEPQK